MKSTLGNLNTKRKTSLMRVDNSFFTLIKEIKVSQGIDGVTITRQVARILRRKR